MISVGTAARVLPAKSYYWEESNLRDPFQSIQRGVHCRDGRSQVEQEGACYFHSYVYFYKYYLQCYTNVWGFRNDNVSLEQKEIQESKETPEEMQCGVLLELK